MFFHVFSFLVLNCTAKVLHNFDEIVCFCYSNITEVSFSLLLSYYVSCIISVFSVPLQAINDFIQRMNRNLKIIWLIGSVTILLLFCTQAYWLFNQYQYNLDQRIEQFKEDCDLVLRTDFRKRKALSEKKSKKYATHKLVMKIDNELDDKKTPKSQTTITYYDNDSFLGVVAQAGITSDDAYEMGSRYLANLTQKPMKSSIYSLLKAKGYDEIEGFREARYKQVFLTPRYQVSGKWLRRVKVDYQNNPIFKEGISFVVGISVASVLKMMLWQLVGSVLLFVILACCLSYLIKTIVVQKRIDGIRHEFLKNMIYEMKQPKTEENTDETAIFIGAIAFFYGLNELRNGNKCIIITSRQAEILRLLALHQNQLVERETILNEVWGDDSYSNSLALNVQITYLRRALSSDASVSIEAVIKKGYILKVNKESTAHRTDMM